MRILNPTGLTAAPLPGRIGFPGHSLTIIVKGLYKLTPNQVDELLKDELAFPTGDILLNEDDEHSEIRYESDFAYYKPCADLMLVGKCHPPGDQAVTYCPVTFRVGNYERRLAVFGDRVWDYLGTRMGKTEPFTEMELTWERAFGGTGFDPNPVGRGYKATGDGEEDAAAPRLPNIEDPERLIVSPGDRPTPAGFGPIQRGWKQRASRVGTYGGDWQRNRWPWFPEDMDWSMFNAAPERMQAEQHLRGDEEVYLENIHPEAAQFNTRLPGIRVRCFLSELPPHVLPPPRRAKARADWTPPPREQMSFSEVPMALDTVWVDAEARMLVLLWRGYAEVRSEDFDEVQHLFVMTEPLEDPLADVATCNAEFWRLHDEDEGLIEEAVPEAAADEEGESAEESPGEEEDAVHAEVDQSLAELRADLEKMGIDPDNPPEVTEEEKEQAKEYFREQGRDDIVAMLEERHQDDDEPREPPLEPWSRERVEAQYADDGDLEGADLRNLDLSELKLDGANLTGANLTGADLRGVSLVGAVLVEANLSDADLASARLDEAQLSQCDLSRASLRGASLAEADLTEARLEAADLTQANLTDAVLEKSNLRRAGLVQAEASDATFVEADLTGALLRDGTFDGADFAQAVLDGADARDASFVSAEFRLIHAVEAVFLGSTMTGLRAADALDMSRANFSQIQAPDSIWTGATLQETDFSHAVLDGADFTHADLEGANLSAARLRTARFISAEMTGAWLIQADIFEGSFEKANLTRADLSGASLYAAELLDAQFHEARGDGANLKMTKYA